MVICPNCHNQELSGALFCSECGTSLVVPEASTTQHIDRNQTGILSFQSRPSSPPDPMIHLGNEMLIVSLHLIESGVILNLSGKTEFTLGRSIEGQPVVPDVDLTPYEAYTQGVSRLHAILRLNNQRVSITDLGSSNGTRVNGQKLLPNVEFPLNHGDVLALGKFKMQVLIRKS
jgi:hypothetical protein